VRIFIAPHDPSRDSRKGPFSALASQTDRPTGGFRTGYRCQAAIHSPGIIRRGSSRRCCIASATISSISSSVFGLRGPDRRPVMWLARADAAEVDRPGHCEEFLLVGHGVLGPGQFVRSGRLLVVGTDSSRRLVAHDSVVVTVDNRAIRRKFILLPLKSQSFPLLSATIQAWETQVFGSPGPVSGMSVIALEWTTRPSAAA
jgi:hypothetical protein